MVPMKLNLINTYIGLSHVLSREKVFQIEWITIANAPKQEMTGMCVNQKGEHCGLSRVGEGENSQITREDFAGGS